MYFDWQAVLSAFVASLSVLTATYAMAMTLSKRHAMRDMRRLEEVSQRMHADISNWEVGGIPVPHPITEHLAEISERMQREDRMARVISEGFEEGGVEDLWRQQRASLRHVGCERWIFNIIDGPNRHRMEFISQADADNYVRSIPHGFVHQMEQRVTARDELRTFGDPIAHVLPQRYELEYDIVINPMDAVERGGIPLRSNQAAERFGAAFGPLPPDYVTPQAERITERGRHFALGVMYNGRRYDVGVHATHDGRDFEFDPNPNITPEMLGELRHQILADMRTRNEFYYIMAARTGVPVQALDDSEQQRQAMLYGSWERVGSEVDRPQVHEHNQPENFTPDFRNTPTASSCFAVVTHEGAQQDIADLVNYRLSDDDARRLGERMQAAERQERESRRRFTESMRHERQSEQQKKEAHKKAIELLKNILTDDELRELDELDSVTLKTSEGLFRVKIDKGKSGPPAYNVYHKKQKWCVNLSPREQAADDMQLALNGYPSADHYAMQILLLKTDPKRFMKTANKKPYDDD